MTLFDQQALLLKENQMLSSVFKMTLMTTINRKSTSSYFQTRGWIWTNLRALAGMTSLSWFQFKPYFRLSEVSSPLSSFRSTLHPPPLNSIRTVYILRRHLLKDSHGQFFYFISSPVDAMTFQPGDKFPKGTISLYWPLPKSWIFPLFTWVSC